MKTKNYVLLIFSVFLSSATSVFAQSRRRLDPVDDMGAACGLFGCGIVVYLLIIFAMFAVLVGITIFIIKWIRKDAVSRGMANADTVKWWGLLGIPGLIIYVLTRPDGRTMPPPQNPPRPPGY